MSYLWILLIKYIWNQWKPWHSFSSSPSPLVTTSEKTINTGIPLTKRLLNQEFHSLMSPGTTATTNAPVLRSSSPELTSMLLTSDNPLLPLTSLPATENHQLAKSKSGTNMSKIVGSIKTVDQRLKTILILHQNILLFHKKDKELELTSIIDSSINHIIKHLFYSYEIKHPLQHF